MDVKLLPHQYEVLADTETKIIGLVGGYGNGKTYTACRKAIQLSFLNAGSTGIVTEPTYPMLRDIFIPEMKLALEEWGVPYKFNASNSIFFLDINGKETKILCMSMENVERLVGVNAAFILCDEFDTTKPDIAMKAFNKLLGRLRSGNVRQFIITTTPEGFRATYAIFVKENDGSRRLIQAKTSDNKYLPQDFIDTLKAQYSSNLLEAYLNGNFVNMTSGTVYKYFNRDTHHSDITSDQHETLIIGQDWNIEACVSIIYVKRGDKIIAVNEIVSYDTRAIIENVTHQYPNRYIEFYPDSSGNNRKTNAEQTDMEMLRNAGFMVYSNASNPSVMDRVNIMNNMFEKRNLLINTKLCPRFTEALEQQAWDAKTGAPEKGNTHPEPSDFNDAGGYPIAYLYPITSSLQKVKMIGY